MNDRGNGVRAGHASTAVSFGSAGATGEDWPEVVDPD